MANERLARRYATAVFMLAKETQSIDAIGADLKTLCKAIFDDEETKEFFLSPVVDRTDKERALTQAFASSVHEIALHTVLLLVRKHRPALLPEVVEQYQHLQRQARGEELLLVTSAKAIPDNELRELVLQLEKTYKTHFDVAQKVDPELIGGLRITLGDRRIDGTVAGRLDELARELFASA